MPFLIIFAIIQSHGDDFAVFVGLAMQPQGQIVSVAKHRSEPRRGAKRIAPGVSPGLEARMK